MGLHNLHEEKVKKKKAVGAIHVEEGRGVERKELYVEGEDLP